MEIGEQIPKGIQRVKRQNHKLTSTRSSKERRKIQDENRYFRTCNRRSIILRAKRKMKTYHILIKDNTIS